MVIFIFIPSFTIYIIYYLFYSPHSYLLPFFPFPLYFISNFCFFPPILSSLFLFHNIVSNLFFPFHFIIFNLLLSAIQHIHYFYLYDKIQVYHFCFALFYFSNTSLFYIYIPCIINILLNHLQVSCLFYHIYNK